MLRQCHAASLTLLLILTGCGGESNPVSPTQGTAGQPAQNENSVPIENSSVPSIVEPTDPETGEPIVLAPGVQHVTLRRLNRDEYNNTIEQTLGIGNHPANSFPADNVSDGFKTIGDVQSTSPLQVSLYFNAAMQTADALFANSTINFSGSRLNGSMTTDDQFGLFNDGDFASMPLDAISDGFYTINITGALAEQNSGFAQATVFVDNDVLTQATVTDAHARVLSARKYLQAGNHTLHIEVYGDMTSPLMIQSVEIIPPDANPVYQYVADAISCADLNEISQCLPSFIEKIGRLIWRRPLSSTESMALSDVGQTVFASSDVEGAYKSVVVAMLSSPHFIFRKESGVGDQTAAEHPLSDLELASRLSYFLWSAAPDEELLALAEQELLNRDSILSSQIDRMLHAPQSRALAEMFAVQWLGLGELKQHEPDSEIYPEWSPAVQYSSVRETQLLFQEYLHNDRPFDEILVASDSWINQTLAEHYKLPPAASQLFRKTNMSNTDRAGILGHSSFLTITSFPGRTSLVKRGQWVLRNLLCDEPPPPPPGVEGLPEANAEDLTIREQMEIHRANPVCNSCHEVMDNIGFGFEHFDATGQWRATDNDQPIDSKGILDNQSFSSSAALADIIRRDERFPLCVTRKMLTYALGRGLDDSDDEIVSDLSEQWTDHSSGTLAELVTVIASSKSFRFTAPDYTPVGESTTQYLSAYEHVYFRGSPNKWSADEMKLIADNVWQIEVTHEDEKGTGFKFDIYADWTLNFGDDELDGIGDDHGKNIKFTEGLGDYRITFDDRDRSYTIELLGEAGVIVQPPVTEVPVSELASIFPQLYFRGAHNDWDLSTPMVLIAENTWAVEVNQTGPRDDGFKFDVFGDWKQSFGLSSAEGVAKAAGKNIPFPEGFGRYWITFNDATLNYMATLLDAQTPPVELPAEPPESSVSIDSGAQFYLENCSGCHGDEAVASDSQTQIDLAATLDEMTSTIDVTMPLLSPKSCVDECAINVASYLKTLTP